MVSSPIIADGLIYYISEDGSINCRGNHRLPTGEQITGSCVSLPIHLPDEANYEWDRFYSEYLLQNGDIEFSILDDNQATVLIEDIEDGQSIATTAVTNRDAIRLKADFSKETNGEVSLLEWSVTFIESGEEDNETFFYENSFAKMGTPPNCSIDVRNENVGIRNDSAAYKLRYENDTGTHITDWIPTNCSGVNGSTQRETIWANTSEISYSEDVIWFLEIRFKIKNNNSEESFSKWFDIENPEYPDEANPRFIQNSFTPSSQWIATVTPTCTIRVQDRGTDGNTSGLDVTSATYTLTYEDDDGSHTDTFQASCSGSNGTTAIQTITADISDTPDSDSFTDVTEIFFSITDLAGNTNSSLDYSLTVDSEKPFSEISNADSIPSVTNQSPVLIQATANDSLSGINEVTLYYRLTSATQWSTFADDSIPPYEWNFTVGSNNGGEYELCTVAVDNASNEESFPSTPDVMLLFDPNPPSKPSFSSQYRFTTDEVPEFSDVTFSDDYELKQIYYRLSFEGTDEWTSVTENDLTTKTITPTWNLTSSQWEIMQEDITYYIYFRVIDLLGNTYITPSQSEAMQVIRDTDNQTPTPYDPDLSDFDTWQWNNEYTIRLTGSTSDLSSAQLWYRFSTDNTSWSNWAQFGENITSAPFSWTFDLPNGSGYYAFKTMIFTTQGLTQTSNEYIIEIIAFPFIELIVLSVLVILFIIVSIIYFQRKQRW